MNSNNKIKISYINCVLFILMLFFTISIGTAKEPFDSQAGFTAYVNVGSGIDIDTAMGAYDTLEDFSGSHALGTINIVNGDGTSDPIHLYVDTNGWIAAYFNRGDYCGLIQYTDIDYANPAFHSTLEDAISRMCGQLGISYDTVDENLKFYDFEYPEATNFTVIFKVLADDVTSESMNLLIPSTYTVYRNLCYVYDPNFNNGYAGVYGSGWGWWMTADNSRSCYDFSWAAQDTLHTFTIQDWNGVLGNKDTMALVLIYK